MQIIVSTRNRSKAQQIKNIFERLPISLFTLDDVGIEGSAVEDGATLAENALKKARYAWERSKQWSVADDTGIFIDALDGAPGVHSARWAGNISTEEIMRFTLEQLRDVPEGKRGAMFRTVAALVSPEGVEHIFEGVVSGIILQEPRTKCLPDMPYSAIFVPDGRKTTWAEMTHEERNQKTHRGEAFRKVCEFL